MKKLLAILGAFGLTTSSMMVVVSCSTPTRSPLNFHFLAETFNQAVLKAIADNPLQKPEDGPFDTTPIKDGVIKNMKAEEKNLKDHHIFLKDDEIQNSVEALNSFESLTKFESASNEDKKTHQEYLLKNNLQEDDILIYLDSIEIKASLDNPERISIKIPRMVVIADHGFNILINDNSSITQQGVIKIKP